MELLNKIKSKTDDAYKYIYRLNSGLIVESTFIDKHDGKYIICMPNQTGCRMKCKFCFLSDIENLKVRNIDKDELIFIVEDIINDLKISEYICNGKQLLLSYMGSGEPLLNYNNIVYATYYLKQKYENIRGSIATIIPQFELLDKFEKKVNELNLDFKLHLSLHYTDDNNRWEWMPYASGIENSIIKLKKYSGRKEIHYTLIKNKNDTDKDIEFLINTFKDNPEVTIKFIRFNPKDSSSTIGTSESRIKEIVDHMKNKMNNEIEIYTPPAGDIGGSCGQFLLDYYKKYNIEITK